MKKNIVNNLLTRIRTSSFLNSIMTLSAGIIVSQLISLVTTPIISRIYDPSILGDFSDIVAHSSIIGVVISLGLMTAIMIPKDNDEAKGICRLIALSFLIVTSALFLMSVIFSDHFRLFEVDLDYTIACLILWVYIISINVSSVCYAYVNRQRMYKVLFWNPTIGTVTNAVVSIVLGLAHCGLWGYACGNLFGSILVLIHMIRHANPFKGKIDKQYAPLQILWKYRSFPKYQLPANIISTTSHNLPVLLIKRFFGSAIVGSYSMCMTILGIPTKFLSAPVNRVYYREATERYNEGKDIGDFSYKILVTNIKIAIIPISLLIVFGKQLFVFVLGGKWEQAGSFAAILGIYQLVLFCSNCLSGNYVIIGKKNINLLFSIINITLTAFSLCLGSYLFNNIYYTLTLLTIAGTVYKLLDIGLFLYYTGVKVRLYFRFVGIYIVLPVMLATALRIIMNEAGIL